MAAAPTDPATGTPSPKTQGFTGAPLAIKTAGGKELVLQGESTGGQLGTRSWVGAFDVNTGKLAWRTFTIPAPGEPGSETWKDNHNAWRIGGGGVWQTASYDPGTNLLYLRHRRCVPELRSAVPSGRQSLHGQHHRARRRHRQDRVVLPGNAERALGLRHAEPQDALRRQRSTASTRKVVANFSRNGFYYTLDRNNGQFLRADHTRRRSPGPRGSIRRPASRSTTIPISPVQVYAGVGVMREKPGQESCPWWNGAPTFFPPTLDAKRMIAYVAGAEGCISSTAVKTPMDEKKDYVGLPPCCTEQGRITAHGALWAMDVRTGKIVAKETFQPPTESGMLSTDGGLLFTGHMNGKFAAYDADHAQGAVELQRRHPDHGAADDLQRRRQAIHRGRAGGAVGVRAGGLYQPSAIVAVFGL